jgi:NADPH:quinone reductase-like Zn-dependent oxidoreductase
MGFNLSFLFDRTDRLTSGLRELLDWLASGQLRPPTVTTYPFEAVAAAHRDLESGQTIGKLVLVV